ncbi:MAG: type II secretion system protein [Phycisphaerae bacterium]|nr:type II secretion system protein [Phycisphaerae bacterium]
MKWDSKNNMLRRKAFTMIEVSVALVILGMIAATVLVVINKAVDTVIFWQTKMQAFEIARENMEQLLSKPAVTDSLEYGTSQTNPDINWETMVESFYEPVTSRMWVRAVCSAEFTDAEGQPQKVELTQWLTGLNQYQIMKIIAQQKKLEQYQMSLGDFLDKLNNEMTDDAAQQNDIGESASDIEAWKELESSIGPPPESYESWEQVPEDQFWKAVGESFQKK